LGIPSQKILQGKPKEVSWMMFCPVLILSLVCVIFGVFAYQLPLKYIIYPIVGIISLPERNLVNIPTILIILGIFLGLAVYYLSRSKKVSRSDNCFIGGETISVENKVSGTEFYNTIKEFGLFNGIYKKAEGGLFDIYEQAKILVLGVGKFLQYLHNGILPTYLVWTLLGMIILFWNLFR
jgi:NADH:ubiquinone oxidoreductase subunit 5 (subunit L)/multisubunit Na+/H+ antiporter MnhA subunit